MIRYKIGVAFYQEPPLKIELRLLGIRAERGALCPSAGRGDSFIAAEGYRLLLYLVENRHRVVSKQALAEAVWSGRCISDATVETTILAVRRALGDKVGAPRFIQTVHGHGYRFVAETAEKPIPPRSTGRPRTPLVGPPVTSQTLVLGAEEARRSATRNRPTFSDQTCRQITVLCCDFRDLCCAQSDPEALGLKLSHLLVACAAVVRRFEGYWAQILADGFWVYYGYPHVQKDAARRAVLSALAITECVSTLNDDFGRHCGMQSNARISIHTGRTCIRGLGGPELLALGAVPVVAARLLGLAAPGTVVISEDTAELVDQYFQCEAIGTVSGGDATEAIEAYRIRRV